MEEAGVVVVEVDDEEAEAASDVVEAVETVIVQSTFQRVSEQAVQCAFSPSHW
jgi:DNA-binding GntR family transcriptional regulator